MLRLKVIFAYVVLSIISYTCGTTVGVVALSKRRVPCDDCQSGGEESGLSEMANGPELNLVGCGVWGIGGRVFIFIFPGLFTTYRWLGGVVQHHLARAAVYLAAT